MHTLTYKKYSFPQFVQVRKIKNKKEKKIPWYTGCVQGKQKSKTEGMSRPLKAVVHSNKD